MPRFRPIYDPYAYIADPDVPGFYSNVNEPPEQDPWGEMGPPSWDPNDAWTYYTGADYQPPVASQPSEAGEGDWDQSMREADWRLSEIARKRSEISEARARRAAAEQASATATNANDKDLAQREATYYRGIENDAEKDLQGLTKAQPDQGMKVQPIGNGYFIVNGREEYHPEWVRTTGGGGGGLTAFQQYQMQKDAQDRADRETELLRKRGWDVADYGTKRGDTLEDYEMAKADALAAAQRAEEQAMVQLAWTAARTRMQEEAAMQRAAAQIAAQAAGSMQQAYMQALPYRAMPGQEYYMGFEPGGVASRIASLSGRSYNPSAFKAPIVDFDPSEVWQKALAGMG